VETLLTTGKTAKQIAAIKDDHIRNKLQAFFRMMILRFATTVTSFAKIVMDIYAIARLFRDFDPSVVKHSSFKQFRGTSQNVIYYAGRQHIDLFKLHTKFITHTRNVQSWYIGLVFTLWKFSCDRYAESRVYRLSSSFWNYYSVK